MPNTNKIALIGKMRCGKDILADHLYSEYGHKRYAFGDELKRHYHEIFGETTVKPRKSYQWFGQAMRQHQPDIWVQKLFDKLDKENPPKIVITDCRQPNEYERLLQEGFLLIRINASLETRIARMKLAGDDFLLEDLDHETEKYIDTFQVHLDLDNNGTKQELFEQFEKTKWEGGLRWKGGR